MKESNGENVSAEVCKMLKSTAKVELKEEEILAAHRLPSKLTNAPRPVILKVKNTDIKSRVMKQRSQVKSAGIRLSHDVTMLNTRLVQRLSDHENVSQAWYYNGSVFAKLVDSDARIKFDITDDVDLKIRRKIHHRPT